MTSTAGWTVGLSAPVAAGAAAALSVVEHVAATLPGGVAGYKPRTPVPALLADSEPWYNVTEEKGVKVYGRKCPGGPPYAVGVTRFTQSAETVASYLFNPDNMHKWNDELCEDGKVLSMFNPDAALSYLKYYGEDALGINIVSPRNLIVASVRETLETGTILIGSHSVDDALGPAPPKGTIRARLRAGGGVVVPSQDGGCTVMFMTQVDFGGGLPQRIVTMVSKTSPLSLLVAQDILSGKKKA